MRVNVFECECILRKNTSDYHICILYCVSPFHIEAGVITLRSCGPKQKEEKIYKLIRKHYFTDAYIVYIKKQVRIGRFWGYRKQGVFKRCLSWARCSADPLMGIDQIIYFEQSFKMSSSGALKFTKRKHLKSPEEEIRKDFKILRSKK